MLCIHLLHYTVGLLENYIYSCAGKKSSLNSYFLQHHFNNRRSVVKLVRLSIRSIELINRLLLLLDINPLKEIKG